VLWQVQWPLPDLQVIGVARAVADWFYLPAGLAPAQIRTTVEALRAGAVCDEGPWVVLGVALEETLRRSTEPIDARRDAASRARCDAVLVEDAEPGALKAGRPFHRLARLRERGEIELIFLDAADVPTAAWMVEHTPAHAVCVGIGLADLTAEYALLPAAQEMGTAVIARAPQRPAWSRGIGVDPCEDLSYLVADQRVSAVLRALPRQPDELTGILTALSRPMDAPSRSAWWSAFEQSVPPPSRPGRSHPPDPDL
jgi:hypothetical protein